MTLDYSFDDLFRAADRREPSGAQLRDQALDRLEAARVLYVMRARAIAEAIYARQGFVTVDCIRRELPPPPEIDGRVMGCLLRKRDGWRVEGDTHSARRINHNKKIARFVKFVPRDERARACA